MRRLFSGSPGTTTGPFLLPLRRAARLSRRTSPSWRLGPWHLKQFSARTGRTFFSKNSSACGSDLSGAAGAGPAASKTALTTRTAYFMKDDPGGAHGGRARVGLLLLLSREKKGESK